MSHEQASSNLALQGLALEARKYSVFTSANKSAAHPVLIPGSRS